MVYMIPSFLDEEAIQTIPAYVLERIKTCEVFFVENERSARRFIRALDKSFVIDQYEWITIHKTEELARSEFRNRAEEGKIIGILSEAGCPGIADPGQFLAGLAHEMDIAVLPLVGPSSILLALMASGMNGQHFGLADICRSNLMRGFKAYGNSKLNLQKQTVHRSLLKRHTATINYLKSCLKPVSPIRVYALQ